MDEDPSGGAPQMTGSTSGTNSFTSSGSMTNTDEVAAQKENGLEFDGIDDCNYALSYE